MFISRLPLLLFFQRLISIKGPDLIHCELIFFFIHCCFFFFYTVQCVICFWPWQHNGVITKHIKNSNWLFVLNPFPHNHKWFWKVALAELMLSCRVKVWFMIQCNTGAQCYTRARCHNTIAYACSLQCCEHLLPLMCVCAPRNKKNGMFFS